MILSIGGASAVGGQTVNEAAVSNEKNCSFKNTRQKWEFLPELPDEDISPISLGFLP
jgi:hypothetical protein